MNLKQVILNNTGMQQDLSISKEGKDFAYKNLNIRIQATGDGTLASITNIKSPKKILGTIMKGVVLNSILCNKYIVVFTHDTNKDYIYRIDLDVPATIPINNQFKTLYEGNLNFHANQPIDSTFYYENDKVQKVYWVDGWTSNGSNNYPRVINIITEGERNGGTFTPYDADTNFDFYPQIGNAIPQITATKNFNVASELPAGTIQYFVSYFNHNMSETLIAGQSFLYSIDLKTRGASADKTGCAFDITIDNVDSSKFEYLRLYSVRRTTFNGGITVNLVKEIKLDENSQSYTLQDNGIGQETLDPSQIFFVGGTPLFAKTIAQKDGTLFIGGLKTDGVVISSVLKEKIALTIQENSEGIKEAKLLVETHKTLPSNGATFNAYYPYTLQKDSESIDIKTFKVGEIYRFGIQFQNKQGQWSEIVWIGDKKITYRPTYNSTDDTFDVSNITLVRGAYSTIFSDALEEGFVNYRLVMADSEYSNGRSIIAQGVVNPTMFSPSLRTLNAPHTFSSWIMRPRNTKKTDVGTEIYKFRQIPCHHLEPLESASNKGSELATYSPNEKILNPDTGEIVEYYHTMPFEFIKADSSNFNKTGQDINFYIDESIVDLYSPDLNENTNSIKGAPKFRIIGCVPLTSNYSTAEVTVDPIGIELDYTPGVEDYLISGYKVAYSNVGNINPLYADCMYCAPRWYQSATLLAAAFKDYYNIHMWHFTQSIVGFNVSEDKVQYPNEPAGGVSLTVTPLQLKNKTFYNHLFSKAPRYLNTEVNFSLNYGAQLYRTGDEGLQLGKGTQQYWGNLDYSHVNEATKIYCDDLQDNTIISSGFKTISASTPITFDTDYHAFFYLGLDDDDKINILPCFYYEIQDDEDENEIKLETPYNGIYTGKYDVNGYWEDITNSSTIFGKHKVINKVFSNNLNTVATKLGASWIEDFASYKTASVQDVYDSQSSPKYKTCCALGVSNLDSTSPTYEQAYLFVANAYGNFSNYDYTEKIEINGTITDCIVVMLAVVPLSGIAPSTNRIRKCYWPKGETPRYNYSNPSDRNITIIDDLTDAEFNKVYPFLCGGYYNISTQTLTLDSQYSYISVWESGAVAPGNVYKVASPYAEGDDNRANITDLQNLSVFDSFVYTQQIIPEECPKDSNGKEVAYLFLGELYYDITYSNLYGGYSQDALDKLVWTPASKPTPLNADIQLSEGDTYYQRWDCLKTFPRTESDINQVIDITSFMVETHINLDERTDQNRATFNPVVRQLNFNLFNSVYNQSNNLFSYTTVNQLMSEENSHQVAWSMTKNILGTVDTWTNISASNVVNLKYPVTKLVNFNNKILGLTEHSVEVINFNARNLVPTEDNTFIELKNSSKVDGTIDFTLDKGTTNPSVLITEAGLYFIDDNENSLMRINYSGEIQNLGTSRMDSWFKNNIELGNHIANTKAFHFSYDSKYKDVYIGNEDSVIVYNELLNNFTSFVDLQELVSLHTFKGNTYAIAKGVESNSLYEMYAGYDYGHGFNRKDLPYSIQYRVNPGPYSDKVFTNVEFRADLGVSSENKSASNVKPFDTIQAWTEYQDTGIQPLVYDRLNTLREKFRTWRALIPRNEHTRDRIRNPWMHLKLDKPNVNGQKLEFHNITVTYME